MCGRQMGKWQLDSLTKWIAIVRIDCKSVRIVISPYASLLIPMGPYRSLCALWDHMSLYLSFCVFMGPYGSL